jgi:hypothetical protein
MAIAIPIALAAAAAASAAAAQRKEKNAYGMADLRSREAAAESQRRSGLRMGELTDFTQRYTPENRVAAANKAATDYTTERTAALAGGAPGQPTYQNPDALAWNARKVAEEGTRMNDIVRQLSKLDAPTRMAFSDSINNGNFSSDYLSRLRSDAVMRGAQTGEARTRAQNAPAAGAGWRTASSIFGTLAAAAA